MKDFYDIYYLSRTFDFEGEKLQAAIFETLQRRGLPMTEIALSVLLHLPMMRICRSVGNIS